MIELIVIIAVSFSTWFIGWVMGYKKGYDINKIYRNMYLRDNYTLNKKQNENR
jgi:hypothetical protein